MKVVDEILKSHRRDNVLILFLFLFSLVAFMVSYLTGEIDNFGDKKEKKKCYKCEMYVPTNGSIIFSECENDPE